MSGRPVKVAVAPLNLHVKDFTSDFRKPFDVDLDGVLNRRGTFKVTGPVVIDPLKATLHVTTRRLDFAFADPYVTKALNATIKSGSFTNNGIVTAAMVRDDLHLSYRGDATIGNVRTLDKLTGDEFVRWNSLSFNSIDFGLGQGRAESSRRGDRADGFLCANHPQRQRPLEPERSHFQPLAGAQIADPRADRNGGRSHSAWSTGGDSNAHRHSDPDRGGLRRFERRDCDRRIDRRRGAIQPACGRDGQPGRSADNRAQAAWRRRRARQDHATAAATLTIRTFSSSRTTAPI